MLPIDNPSTIFFAIAVIFIIACFYVFLYQSHQNVQTVLQMRERGVIVDGIVTEAEIFQERSGYGKSAHYVTKNRVTVAFKKPNGTSFLGVFETIDRRYCKNKLVKILYDPETDKFTVNDLNADDAMVEATSSLVIFLGMLIGFCVVAACLFFQ